jgi:DNA-cytosine methyltransferase
VNVLSLFDGMSCGQIALNRISVEPTTYYAAEVDKYAITVTQANYPTTVQLGDVTRWREWDIDWSSIDLLIGGSPCQGFSFAGKQLAFDDPRSKLFFVYLEILDLLKLVNPNIKFMLENVKMKKEHLAVITEKLGVKPVFINSALVSAQNRQRYYWCNWEVSQPEDRGVFIKDIVESNSNNFVFMSDKFVKRQEGRRCLVDNLNKKAVTLSAMEYVKNGRQGDYINAAVVVGRRVNPNTNKRDDYNLNIKPVQTLEVHNHGKARCLSSVSKDTLVTNLPAGKYPNSKHYRKFTPVECERLQTVPDNYTNHVSNTQRYKMLGNGWTVDVIAHVLREGLTNGHHG